MRPLAMYTLGLRSGVVRQTFVMRLFLLEGTTWLLQYMQSSSIQKSMCIKTIKRE